MLPLDHRCGLTMRTVMVGVAVAFASATALEAQSLTGEVRTVTIVRGDTLRSLGSRFGVDPITIARDGGRALDTPLRVGDQLLIDNRHVIPPMAPGTPILVNVPQRMLFIVNGAGLTEAYPVAIGRSDWPTPLGEFSIVSKEVNPTWDVPQSIREEARRAGRSLPMKVPPGPRNPLGAHWLGLSLGSVGIHGTDAPTSIYQGVTHGCIRLHPDDVSALFGQVHVGMRGDIVYQPILVGIDGGQVFVEAHRDLYRRGPSDALEFVRTQTRQLGVFERVNWEAVDEVIRQRAGVARAVSP